MHTDVYFSFLGQLDFCRSGSFGWLQGNWDPGEFQSAFQNSLNKYCQTHTHIHVGEHTYTYTNATKRQGM